MHAAQLGASDPGLCESRRGSRAEKHEALTAKAEQAQSESMPERRARSHVLRRNTGTQATAPAARVDPAPQLKTRGV